MDESRILIIGAHGQLGRALQAKYPAAKAVDRDIFDMTDWTMIEQYDWTSVDVILNAAGYTNVDDAETAEGRELAWKINATGAGYLSKVVTAHNLTLVHISSEYVFDGTKESHKEDEPFTPLGVYAQAKAAGDIAVGVSQKHYIVRTSWLIGDGPNFVRTMMGLAEKNISPTVVADQIGRLTFTQTLVAAIDHLLVSKAPYGTYNASNDGEPVSWAAVTRVIFKELGRNDLQVTDTTTKAYFASKQGVAPRPLNSAFDLSKLRSVGFVASEWPTALHEYMQTELAKPKETT